MSTKSIKFLTHSLLKSLFMVFGSSQRPFRGLDWIKSTVHVAIFKVLYTWWHSKHVAILNQEVSVIFFSNY